MFSLVEIWSVCSWKGRLEEQGGCPVWVGEPVYHEATNGESAAPTQFKKKKISVLRPANSVQGQGEDQQSPLIHTVKQDISLLTTGRRFELEGNVCVELHPISQINKLESNCLLFIIINDLCDLI